MSGVVDIPTNSGTPGSMNSLFGDFFRKFGGVFLEVFGIISGGIWEEFGRFSVEFPRNFLEFPRNSLGNSYEFPSKTFKIPPEIVSHTSKNTPPNFLKNSPNRLFIE